MRIDLFVADREGISRTRAAHLIQTGGVTIQGKTVWKPSFEVKGDEAILVSDTLKYVSLGGVKLERALSCFHLDPKDLTCLDIGASNGGFTDCLLKSGARSVLSTDLHIAFPPELSEDPRVSLLDRVNAKDLGTILQGRSFDLITVDLSFISLTSLFPVFAALTEKGGKLICLFKPQFEVGKKDLPKSGIVRDKKAIEKAFRRVSDAAKNAGFQYLGACDVPKLFEDKNPEQTVLFAK